MGDNVRAFAAAQAMQAAQQKRCGARNDRAGQEL